MYKNYRDIKIVDTIFTLINIFYPFPQDLTAARASINALNTSRVRTMRCASRVLEASHVGVCLVTMETSVHSAVKDFRNSHMLNIPSPWTTGITL